jgi:hypothetical protein
MLAELLQAMPKNDLANAIEDAPTTRKEPFWNDRESNLFSDAVSCGSAFFILRFRNSRRPR